MSLTVLDRDDLIRSVTLFGNVVDIHDDEDQRVADRLAQHYFGFRTRIASRPASERLYRSRNGSDGMPTPA